MTRKRRDNDNFAGNQEMIVNFGNNWDENVHKRDSLGEMWTKKLVSLLDNGR